MKLFITSNNSLNADRAEMVKFVSQICDEYGSSLIEIVENNCSTQDELIKLMAGCDLFLALTDTDVEEQVMKEFNAATICNTKGRTPIIYVYNREPEEGATPTPNYEVLSSYLIDEAKRLWCRYEHFDFMRIQFALQLEAFNPCIFETKLIGSKVYLRNLEVGDMVQCSAVLYSHYYSNLQKYYTQTEIALGDLSITPNEKFQNVELARIIRQRIQTLLASYYEIYKRMITLPSRASSSQLRIGYNNMFNGNATESLKVLNIEELTATVSRLVGKMKNSEKLTQYEEVELEGAIEAMGLRALVIMTDSYNPNYIDQAVDALQKAILFAREAKASPTIYAQHLTAYALFLNKHKNNSDGAKWYEGVLEMLLRTDSKDYMLLGKAYLNAANYYIAVGNDEKAMWALKQSLSIVSKLSQGDPIEGLIYWGFAKVHSRRGECLEALTCCSTGEKLYLMTHSEGDLESIKFWFMQINLRKEASQPPFSEEEYLAKEQMMLRYYGDDEPLIEFYLFFSDMYADAKRYSDAIEILYKALAISGKKLGDLCVTTQVILYRLMLAFRYMDDDKSALKVAEELISRLRLAPTQHQDMKRAADTFFLMGRIKDSLEDYKGAVETLSDALTLYNSVVGEDCDEKAECYKHIGDIFAKCGQSETAMEHYQNALRIVEPKYGECSVEAAAYYNRIAEEHLYANNSAEAEEYYQKIIKLDGGNSEDLTPIVFNAVLGAYIGVGSCQFVRSEYKAAKETYEFLMERFGSFQTLSFSDVYLKYASSLKECGEDQKALDNYFAALKIKVQHYGDEAKYTAPIYIEIARLYESYNMSENALENYTKGLRAYTKSISDCDEYLMMNYYRVARIQIFVGNYQEGFEAALRAKEIYDKLELDSKIEYARICGYLSDAAIKLAQTLEDAEMALGYKNIAFEIYEQLGDLSACAARRDMGLIYEKMAQPQKAMECFKYELDRYDKELEPKHIYVGYACENLARILFSLDTEEMKNLALDYQQKALGVFEHNESQIDAMRIVSGLATIYNSLEQYELEIFCLEKLIAFFRENEEDRDEESYADALQRAAVTSREIYAYGDSETYLKELLELQLKLKGEESEEVALTYYEMAKLYHEGERCEDAVEYGELALNAARKLYAADSLEVLNAMSQLDTIYCYVEAYDEAIKLVMERVDLVQNKEGRGDMDLAIVYYHVSLVYKSKGDYCNQIEWLERSIEEEQGIDDENSTSVANSLFSLGEAYRLWGNELSDKEKYIKAKDVLLRAADIYEECDSLEDYSSSEITNWATCYIYVSNICSYLKEYDEALTFVETAEILFKANKDISNQVICHNSYAMIYDEMGNFEKAIEHYNSAIELLDEDDINRYIIYSNIARCYQVRCNYEEMLKYMTRAYDATFGLVDDNDYHRATIYSNLGDGYAEVGDYDKAKECFDEALFIYDKKEEESITLAYHIASMGYVTFINKEYEKSIEYNKRALDMRLRIVGEKSQLTASVYNQLGRAYTYTGRFSEARELIFKAFDIRKLLGDDKPSDEMASSLYAIGELLLFEGRYSEAEQYLMDSIAQYTEVYNDQHTLVARSLHTLGVVYKRSGDLSRGVSYLNAALAIRTKFLRENHPETIETQQELK